LTGFELNSTPEIQLLGMPKVTTKDLKGKGERKREHRYFEESLRIAIVKELDEGKITVSEVCRIYQVSKGAVYKWLNKYSSKYEKAIIKIVELKSESRKKKELEQKVKELEQLVGKKQFEVEFLKKLIEIAEEKYGIDFKKNSDTK
jgi:transposase